MQYAYTFMKVLGCSFQYIKWNFANRMVFGVGIYNICVLECLAGVSIWLLLVNWYWKPKKEKTSILPVTSHP